MALAFLFGVAFGWVVWGARPDRMDGGGGDAADGGREDPKEIVVIKAELHAARSLLDQVDDGDEGIGEQISALDETVKRANGRLKTILAMVKRAAEKK
jgi:archaellum component FlaC